MREQKRVRMALFSYHVNTHHRVSADRFLFARNLESGVRERKPEFLRQWRVKMEATCITSGLGKKSVDGKDITYSDSKIQCQSNRSKIYRRKGKTRTRGKVSGVGKGSEQNCPRDQE